MVHRQILQHHHHHLTATHRRQGRRQRKAGGWRRWEDWYEGGGWGNMAGAGGESWLAAVIPVLWMYLKQNKTHKNQKFDWHSTSARFARFFQVFICYCFFFSPLLLPCLQCAAYVDKTVEEKTNVQQRSFGNMPPPNFPCQTETRSPV